MVFFFIENRASYATWFLNMLNTMHVIALDILKLSSMRVTLISLEARELGLDLCFVG